MPTTACKRDDDNESASHHAASTEVRLRTELCQPKHCQRATSRLGVRGTYRQPTFDRQSANPTDSTGESGPPVTASTGANYASASNVRCNLGPAAYHPRRRGESLTPLEAPQTKATGVAEASRAHRLRVGVDAGSSSVSRSPAAAGTTPDRERRDRCGDRHRQDKADASGQGPHDLLGDVLGGEQRQDRPLVEVEEQ